MLRRLLRKMPGYRLLINPLIKREFWRSSDEDENRVRFYGELLSHGDLAFDVGANMGSRSKAFLMLGAQVVAFEPQQECINYLQAATGHHPDFTLVAKALGDRESEMEMRVSDEHVLSTLSTSWQKATQESGRFGDARWDRSQVVTVTTLAHAIEKFGVPKFVKIDVEGYEYDVVSTLSCPIDCISVEFTSEYLENTLRCVEHFETLANDNVYQLSMGESMEFFLGKWVQGSDVPNLLHDLPPGAWGDLYVKMQ